MTEALARAHLFSQFDAFASRKGLDFDRLLAAEGLSRQDLSELDNEIPLNAAAHILDMAAIECGDPCFGLLHSMTTDAVFLSKRNHNRRKWGNRRLSDRDEVL